MVTGRIARLPIDLETNERRGYGFITPDVPIVGTRRGDVFFHARGMDRDFPFNDLTEGLRVAFEVVDDHRGPQAREVRVLDGDVPNGAHRVTDPHVDEDRQPEDPYHPAWRPEPRAAGRGRRVRDGRR